MAAETEILMLMLSWISLKYQNSLLDKFGLVKCAKLTQVVVDLLKPRALNLLESAVSGDLEKIIKFYL